MGFLSYLFPSRTPEPAADRAAWLDASVRSAAAHVQGQYLAELRTARRSFEAAETPAWTDSWPTHAANINEDLARQLPTLRARSRGLARNNEWAIRYLIQLDDNVLGEAGLRLQMRLMRRDGTADDDTNTRLEEVFALWGKDCEVSGLSWREVETLVLANLPQDGELLYRLRPGAGPFGFQIQLLDPALIDVSLHRDWGGNRVRMGVEITDDGRPVAYWLRMAKSGDGPTDLVTVGRHVRVPAEQLRHRFLRREVGQIRGYPWLAGGARRLWLLADFEEAAAVACSNAAKRQGFFITKDGEAPRGFADVVVSSVLESAKAAGKVLTPDEIQAITAAAEKYSTTVPGQFDTLPQGTEFQKFDTAWPNIEAGAYSKQQLRGWAAARGMSYVTLGNDLEAVNYSSARVGILDEREHYKTVQGLLKTWLHAEVLAAALPYLVLQTPSLQPSRLPAYLAAATWQPRRWAGIDPVKESTANEINLRLKLTSRRRLILERGDDPDEVFAETEVEEKRFGPLDPENTPRPKDPDDDEDGQGAPKKSRGPGRSAGPLVAVRDF